MACHPPACSFRVPRDDRILHMVDRAHHGAADVVGDVPLDIGVEQVFAERLINADQQKIMARLGHDLVPDGIGLDEWPRRRGGLKLAACNLERRDILVVAVFCSEHREVGLKDFNSLDQNRQRDGMTANIKFDRAPEGLVTRRGGNAPAITPEFGRNQTLRLQNAQRLTDRSTAQARNGNEFALVGQEITGLDVTIENLLGKHLGQGFEALLYPDGAKTNQNSLS